MSKDKLFCLFLLLSVLLNSVSAQRKYQNLDRGIVAVNNGTTATSPILITWRLLAQDTETIKFNLYCNPGGTASYRLLNTSPLSKTNFSTTVTSIPTNSLLCVAPVINEVEGTKSLPFKYVQRADAQRSVYLDMKYSNFLPWSDYVSKFIWPADLDGDGEYDFVVDRLSITGQTSKIEGYLRTGEKLWTVDLGPNVLICQGHDDMVLAYDMNGDGKAEVVIKSSDGTRFWDKTNETWGKYLKNAVNGDTDNDGIVNYETQSVKNEPQYITVLDGMTGAELNTIEMPYPVSANNTYTRTNKADYLSGESSLSGHMGIAYLDGVHPSVVMEYKCRSVSKFHFYYVTAWGYKFTNGQAGNWEQKYTWNREYQNAAEFHHIRIADVDLDGKDEMLEGGYTIDDNGSLLFSANISHGDRFRTGDINPDRPGLETFAIQQNAGDMLGMILYDAKNGTPIKKWYMAGVGDVSRGDCIDLDKNYKGYEMWSTMGNLYNCKGDVIYVGGVDMAKEGIWWDGELDREILDAKDGNGANAMITKYAGNGSFQNNRLIQFASLMNWSIMAEYGCRPAFFGDIAGDWREEVILRKKYYVNDSITGCDGFYAFTTDYPTNYNLYCLMQNAAYRGQTTTKAYYQSPFPDYYLGYDMSQPPLPPFIKTDLVWKSGTTWDASSLAFTGYDESTSLPFIDGKSVLFDLSGVNSDTIRLSGTLQPSVLYVQTPLNHNFIFGGNGVLTGAMDLWKSQNGKLVLNGFHTYTGKTVVSEGTLELNGSLAGIADIRAKGTLAGNALLTDGLTVQPGLNYEGGRLSPGTVAKPFGKITVNNNLTLPGGAYLEMNLQTKGTLATDTLIRFDTLQINGNLTVNGINYLYIRLSEEKPFAGEFPLVSWTGTLTGDSSNFVVAGIKGLSTSISVRNNRLFLIVKGQRSAQPNVVWSGSKSATWNYNDENFLIGEDETPFVNGDQLTFNDESSTKTITMSDYMSTTGVRVSNSQGDYTFKGEGGFSGTGGITKDGTSALILTTAKSDYTGSTVINGGLVEVSALANAGLPSSIGAAAATVSNLIINNAELRVNNVNTATNRGLTLLGEATINVPLTNSYAVTTGPITGSGKLIKTGFGQLSVTYNGPTTYTGGTVVKAGSLAMGTYNTTFGTLGSPLEIQGTSTVSIFNNNSTSAIPAFNYATTIPAGSNVRINGGQRCTVGGTLSGSGNLTFWIPYVRCEMICNWSAFAGTLSIIADADGAQFRLCNANGLAHANVNLGANVEFGHFYQGSASGQPGLTSSLGMLSGVATSQLTNGIYNIGGNNQTATFNGKIAASATVYKYGTGTWILTYANLNTTPVIVYGGTLTVANTTGSATGSGAVNVRSGATLNGTGSISGSVTLESGATLSGNPTIGGAVNVKAGALLQPGTPGSALAKTITINNSLTLQPKSNTIMKVLGGIMASSDKLVMSGTFNPGGVLTVNRPTVAIIQDGYTYVLFTAADIGATRFDSLSLPDLGATMYWDTTQLYTAGTIIARRSTDIRQTISNVLKISSTLVDKECLIRTGDFLGEATIEVLDARGQKMKEFVVSANTSMKIGFSEFAPGVYFLRYEKDENTEVQQVLKKTL
jgi:autotransporter-associated beta strand protein